MARTKEKARALSFGKATVGRPDGALMCSSLMSSNSTIAVISLLLTALSAALKTLKLRKEVPSPTDMMRSWFDLDVAVLK
jgi:hypothetical protein